MPKRGTKRDLRPSVPWGPAEAELERLWLAVRTHASSIRPPRSPAVPCHAFVTTSTTLYFLSPSLLLGSRDGAQWREVHDAKKKQLKPVGGQKKSAREERPRTEDDRRASSRHIGLPLPQKLTTRTPQQLYQHTANKKMNPSERTGSAISYNVHTTRQHGVRNLLARPAGDHWRKKWTDSLPGIVALGNRRQPSDPSRSAPSVPPTHPPFDIHIYERRTGRRRARNPRKDNDKGDDGDPSASLLSAHRALTCPEHRLWCTPNLCQVVCLPHDANRRTPLLKCHFIDKDGDLRPTWHVRLIFTMEHRLD